MGVCRTDAGVVDVELLELEVGDGAAALQIPAQMLRPLRHGRWVHHVRAIVG